VTKLPKLGPFTLRFVLVSGIGKGVLTHMVSPWGAIVEVLAEELVEVDRW